MTDKFLIKPKQILTISILIAIFGLLVYLALSIYPRIVAIQGSYNRLMDISEKINVLVQKKDMDFVSGKELIADANLHILTIQSEVQPYYGIFKRWRSFPWIGKYASQVEPVIEYTSNSISAVNKLVVLTDPIVGSSLYSKRSSKLVQQINANQSLIVSAEENLRRAEIYHQDIQLDLFPGKIQNKLEKISQLQPMLKETITILKLVPDLTGAENPITYLIILQNSDELRPTGGFITAFGLVRIEKGVVTVLEFEDSTNNDYISEVIEAPAPLKQILMAHYWLPRDANWSPSFPESAEQIQRLFYLSTGIKTDAVIAFNQSSLVNVLLFTGPVDVNGKTISSDNVKEYMIEKKMDAIVEGNPENRKEFITPLVKALIDQISIRTGKENLIKFGYLLQNMTQKGDLFVYSNNQGVQSLIEKYKFDGELHPGNGDYLMLVDANLGYSKIDQVISRNLTYIVDLSDINFPTSRIEATYLNPMKGSVICKQGGDVRAEKTVSYLLPSCYWNYWRILGTKGTSLSNFIVPNFDDSYFQDGYGWSHTPGSNSLSSDINEVSGLIVVPPSSQNTILLGRVLPQSVLINTGNHVIYSLNIQKQPGIDQLPFSIEITIPPDAILDAADSDLQLSNLGGKWVWSGNITNTLTKVHVSFINK
jgi:hypothetical protein